MMNKRRNRIDRKVLANARRLREQQTPAEHKLWAYLRAGRLEGIKFRRQHPIGNYIVDFYCAANHLVVEIDGDAHGEREQADAQRTSWLEKQGCSVLRFTNDDVYQDIDVVLTEILFFCHGN